MPVTPEQVDAANREPNEDTQRLFDELDKQLMENDGHASVWSPRQTYPKYKLDQVYAAYSQWDVQYQYEDHGLRDTMENITIKRKLNTSTPE